MEKTAAIMAPRQRVGANLALLVSGQSTRQTSLPPSTGSSLGTGSLRGNHRRQGVVTPDADALRAVSIRLSHRRQGMLCAETTEKGAHHQDTPKDQERRGTNGRTRGDQGAAKCAKDYDGQFNAVHSSAAERTCHETSATGCKGEIRGGSSLGKPSKENHADDDASTSGTFESLVDRVWQDAAVTSVSVLVIVAAPKDHTEHGYDEVDGEDVVRVEEEADPGYEDGADICVGVCQYKVR